MSMFKVLSSHHFPVSTNQFAVLLTECKKTPISLLIFVKRCNDDSKVNMPVLQIGSWELIPGSSLYHVITIRITIGSTICSRFYGPFINTCHSRVFFNNRGCAVKSCSDNGSRLKNQVLKLLILPMTTSQHGLLRGAA